MIIRTEQDVTRAVLDELEHAPDERWRAIMRAAVRHLHDFVRDAQLTEDEFHRICRVIAQLGQATTASHNEVVLAAGSLGISSLVCLRNNGSRIAGAEAGAEGAAATTANLMGPFWRRGAPRLASQACIAAPGTPGDPLFVDACVRDMQGRPVAGVDVDVWHASADGYYENQDPLQPEMNLRGTFTTDGDGHFAFRTVKPAGYPIPANGPVGTLLRMQGRHNMRPAHLHFMFHKPGYKAQFSQVYSSDDPHLQSDVQFGVTQALVGHYVRHEGEPAPAPDVRGCWYSLAHTFFIEEGEARLPPPPVTGKAQGERPAQQVLPGRDNP